mmetsp:Transcript_29603/g.98085  ORF Transcript_29603/g.98085 Transcript_29603/m.98085 type:complete len:262 (+) Transcript_29603:1291-2076(+)
MPWRRSPRWPPAAIATPSRPQQVTCTTARRRCGAARCRCFASLHPCRTSMATPRAEELLPPTHLLPPSPPRPQPQPRWRVPLPRSGRRPSRRFSSSQRPATATAALVRGGTARSPPRLLPRQQRASHIGVRRSGWTRSPPWGAWCGAAAAGWCGGSSGAWWTAMPRSVAAPWSLWASLRSAGMLLRCAPSLGIWAIGRRRCAAAPFWLSSTSPPAAASVASPWCARGCGTATPACGELRFRRSQRWPAPAPTSASAASAAP